MKIKFKHVALSFLALAIIAGSIFFIFRKKIIAHIIPAVEQMGDINIQLKNDTSYISTKFIIKNKTFLKIDINTINYEISLLDKPYLKSQKLIGAVLSGYGKDTIDFSLKIPYCAVIKDLKAQRKKSDSINYTISIYIQFSTILGKFEIPINKSAKIKIPQPPEIEVVEIKYRKFRLKSILADAKIRIINKTNVSLIIKELSYSINILGQWKMKGSFEEPVNIKPRDTTFINIPIEINPKNLGKTIFDIIFKKDNYDYTLTLKAILESPDPLKEYYHINISKTGKMELRK